MELCNYLCFWKLYCIYFNDNTAIVVELIKIQPMFVITTAKSQRNEEIDV